MLLRTIRVNIHESITCKTVSYFRGVWTNLYELTCTVTPQRGSLMKNVVYTVYTRPEFSSHSPENPAPDLATVQHTIDQRNGKRGLVVDRTSLRSLSAAILFHLDRIPIIVPCSPSSICPCQQWNFLFLLSFSTFLFRVYRLEVA